MTRHRSLALAVLLGTTAIAPPAEAHDAASTLLAIAFGVLVGTSSAPQPQPAPQPQQPQQSMRWIDQRCLSEPTSTVCRSTVLRDENQHDVELMSAYVSRLRGPAADQARAEIQQEDARYHASCDRVVNQAEQQDCVVNWLNYWDETYSARLGALSTPSARTSVIPRPVPIPPNLNMRITGKITDATVARFDDFMQQHPATTTVVLDSGGGEVLAGRDLAMRIRHLHLTTVVPADAECASACFMLFAAGECRIASTSAKIGVHSASYEGEEDRDTLAVSTLMARQCSVFGVPDQIIGKMITQPGGGEVTWLSAADLRSMRVDVQ